MVANWDTAVGTDVLIMPEQAAMSNRHRVTPCDAIEPECNTTERKPVDSSSPTYLGCDSQAGYHLRGAGGSFKSSLMSDQVTHVGMRAPRLFVERPTNYARAQTVRERRILKEGSQA
jgi:hypothetical protein